MALVAGYTTVKKTDVNAAATQGGARAASDLLRALISRISPSNRLDCWNRPVCQKVQLNCIEISLIDALI
jgi:hypothetical protein